MTILDQLADHAWARCRLARQTEPADRLRARALALPAGDFAFERALKKPGLSFICECKRASPSKGLIAPEYPYTRIAAEYEAAGADCLSVLTEPKWFLGSNDHLEAIARTVSLPCLRKDFTVDESMIYEARLLGASAVRLIVSLLEPDQLAEYLRICDRLGLSALVETHDPDEVRTALAAGARVIGVNNRNLRDFTVDTDNSRRLRELVSPEVLFVSESGVRTAADTAAAQASRADYVLLDAGAGCGQTFDWSLCAGICRPWFLAGGLDASNVARAVTQLHPWAVDVSSGIETSGYKDPEKMVAFVRAARKGGEP